MSYSTKENSFLSGFVGLFIILIIMGLISKTRAGYVVIYDSLALIIIVIILTQYKSVVRYIGATSNLWST